MSTYFATQIEIAGSAEDVERFNAEVLKDENARPSDRFEVRTLAVQPDGRPVALAYHAGKRRYAPAVEGFASSEDAAGLNVLTRIANFYEQGEASVGVYLGEKTLFDQNDLYLLDDQGTGREQMRESATCFVRAAHSTFGVTVQLP
jgi:hypothetical protein